LDHYLVCEQVTLVNRSSEWSELLLAGAQSERLLGRLTDVGALVGRLDNAQRTLAGKSVWLRRADLVGPVGFLISASSEDVSAVRAALLEAGAVACDESDFEAARVEWGFPWFGIDISDKNFPQEVGRDALAISFVKGCYLGQETVARIDALGHVNKTLVGVRFLGNEVTEAAAELFVGDQIAGLVTSAVDSPHLSAPLALAYVRRGSNTVGTRLSSAAGEAEVVALPVR
jgi:folate-binding protein YgfZ